MKNKESLFVGPQGQNYAFPFILVTSLFFMWGFAHSLLDILNAHFQDSLQLSKTQSAAVQMSAYGAYFLMALPAGVIARLYGYKRGIIVGLSLFAIGAFCFIPAVDINEFWAFLLGLLILFAGLTCLETVANPYTIVLGPPETSASRINLAQTFNALGWICGPLVGSILIFKNESDKSIIELLFDALGKVFTGSGEVAVSVAKIVEESVTDNSALIVPYAGLGVLVVLVFILFIFTKLPEISVEDSTDLDERSAEKPLWKQRHFVLAVIAQFMYVAAQTGIGSFFINYCREVEGLGINELQGGLLLGLGGMSLFAVGRFVGSLAMKKIDASKVLGIFALINTVLMLFVSLLHDRFGIIALIACYLFMSIMFPTIFALALRKLGAKTKTGSSILVLMIVGGAIAPMLMGYLGEEQMNIGFVVPLICFAYISFFGFIGSKIKE